MWCSRQTPSLSFWIPHSEDIAQLLWQSPCLQGRDTKMLKNRQWAPGFLRVVSARFVTEISLTSWWIHNQSKGECTAMWMDLLPPNCTFKTVNLVKFMLCIFYYITKSRDNDIDVGAYFVLKLPHNFRYQKCVYNIVYCRGLGTAQKFNNGVLIR